MERKQLELNNREQLILKTAQNMIHLHGYSYLTMDRIANKVGYSKGTIYNHFSSKEDLVCSLSCRCQKNLLDIFQRAANYDGSSRQRYAAMNIGYALYHQLYPLEAQNIQVVKQNTIREKISPQKLEEMERLEKKLTNIAFELVKQALNEGDLSQQYKQEVSTIVFGSWSMLYGAMLLEQSNVPLQNLGFNPVVKMLWNNINHFLDGYNWQPLSNTFDTQLMFREISSTLFENLS